MSKHSLKREIFDTVVRRPAEIIVDQFVRETLHQIFGSRKKNKEKKRKRWD